MERKPKKAQENELWATIRHFSLVMILFAIGLAVVMVRYVLHILLIPIYIWDGVVDFRYKVKDLPDTSIKKKLVKLYYAIYLQNIDERP